MLFKKVPCYIAILILMWLFLITSLFFDPLTPTLTDANTLASPFRFKSLEICLFFQGQCLTPTPYALGTRLFWGIIIPLAVVCLLMFGARFWRQICPLAWIVQLPRLLGLQPKKQYTISRTSWLATNFPYVTFGLFFLGLNVRLLFVNSDHLGLGIILLLISLAALASGFCFSGRTWCQYFCPMIGVEMIYMGVEGAFGNPFSQKNVRFFPKLCQTIDSHGKPKSSCDGCNYPCVDLHSEKAYWQQILHPGLKWLYYGYVGLIIGFFSYFTLYSGNSQFLKSGALWLEFHQLSTLFEPGFYLFDQEIHIPKILAVPLILGISVLIAYHIGYWLENQYKRLPRNRSRPKVALQHHCFSFCTFISFNLLFFMGVRPSLGWLPTMIVNGVSWLLIVVTTLWLCRALLQPTPKIKSVR